MTLHQGSLYTIPSATLRAPVHPTSARTALPSTCFGHIARRAQANLLNLWRSDIHEGTAVKNSRRKANPDADVTICRGSEAREATFSENERARTGAAKRMNSTLERDRAALASVTLHCDRRAPSGAEFPALVRHTGFSCVPRAYCGRVRDQGCYAALTAERLAPSVRERVHRK